MSQLNLFRPEHADRPLSVSSNPSYIRKSLGRLLRVAREAQIMPWNKVEAEGWEKLFPELAASLPDDEAAVLISEFKGHLARLRSLP